MPKIIVELLVGKQGHPTVRVHGDRSILLHSLYNPIAEAAKVVDQWDLNHGAERVLIVGMGLGYHVLECVQRYPHLRTVVVLECHPEVDRYARQVFPQLYQDERIVVLLAKTEEEFRRMFRDHLSGALCLHMPSVDCLPYPEVRVLLKEMHMIQISTKSSMTALRANWSVNRTRLSESCIVTGQRNQWLNRPGFLIAGGPSLETSLPFFSRLDGDETVILAVTRAMELLVEHHIMPTAFVATESSEALIGHLHSQGRMSHVPPLYALPTVHPNTIRAYMGPVKWVLQSGFDETEAYARSHQVDLFQTGGSVATLALSLLYYFGCNPIVFVGQDLAYVNGRSHAGSVSGTRPSQTGRYVLETVSVHGGSILTSVSWTAFRRWIEHFIETHPDRTYWNVSEGAHIRGTEPRKIEQVMQALKRINRGGGKVS
jgi:Protein of unknown function DUF115